MINAPFKLKPEQEKELDEQMVAYMNDGASDDDLMEFQRLYIEDAKKKSGGGTASTTPSAQPQQPSIKAGNRLRTDTSLSGASSEYQNKLQQKNFVQRFNQPEKNIKNPDGSVSTHKMATAEIDGMNIAFPTIVEKNGKLVELPINEAIDFALQNNEFAEFATPQDAQSWAEGGYKNGTQIGQTTPTTQSLKTPILEDSDKLNPFNNAKPEVRKQKRDYLTESMKVDVTEKPVSTETQAPIDPVQQEQIVERGKVEEKAKNLVYQEATSNKRVDLLDDNVDAKTYGDAAIEDYFEVEKSLKMPNQEDVKIGYGLNTLKVEGFEDLNAVIAEENKYRELMKMNPKEWDNGDQEFIQQVRSKAIAKKVDADAAKLDILEENTDFDGFNKAMVDLAPERQQIEAELTKLKTGQPVDQAALDARIQAFNTQIQAVKEQTGVDDAKIEEYGKLAGNLGALSRAYEREQYSTDYSGIIREQLSEQEEKKFREKRLEFTANLPLNAATLTQKAGVYLDEFARGVSGGVGDMVVSIPQALHVLEQFATGGMDTKYDWIDKMYDSGENMKRAAEGGTGAPVTGNRKMSDMPIAAQIAYTGGNAIGSMATFMAGGALGGASKIGQLSAVFTTAFLGTEAMFYQEAIDAGMNPADASNSATILALGTAGAEMLVNDAALLGAKGFRNQFFKQVAGGVPAKEATKQFFKALGERVAFVSKRAGTEWIEEVPVQQVVEDVSKEQLNNYYGKEYFKNTFDPDVFQQNSIGALFAGGGMAIVSSTGSQHPNTERLMLEAARMSSDQIAAMYQNQQPIQQTLPDGTEITTGRPADYTVELERLKENLAGLEAHSNWGNLSEQEQAHALALTNQINNIEEEQAKMKAVRVKDAAKDEQIAAIEAELNDLFNAPKPKNELEGVRQRINQIEAARERGEILNDETKGELKTLKEKESELSSKPSFENVPVITRTAEEIEFAKNEVFDNLNKLEIGSVIENSDGEIKVVTEKSTDKKGNQLIGITTYERQSDGSLLQMTNIVWAQKNSDGKIKLEYNPHTTGTNSKGERVTVTDQITDKKIDLSKETIFTQDENGNLVRVNNQKQETKPADSLQPATESKPKTEPVVAEDGSYTDENGNTQYIPPLLPLPDTNVQAPQAQRQVNQSEANVLTMLKDSKILSPTEKQMLYKQFKRGVMSENDISKYTQVNVDDIVAGETDKWARVVLDKIKAKQIDAEEIDFIEIPETNTQEDVSKKEEKIDVTEERVDALKDVESTEKALDELDKTDHKKVHELFDSMADMGVDISRRRRMGWSESAFITDEYHKAKADGTNPELVKAVEDLLAPKTTTGTEAPVATKTGKTVAPINLPPTVVEQGEDNVNMTDTPVVPFKKAKDLLGNDREPWMFEATESERSQAQQKNTMRGSQFFPKKIRAIQNALDNGLFQQAISDGKITSIDAVKIIESAGLAVPENILTKTKQEVKPEVKKGKNSAKAQAYRDKAKALRDGTGGTVIASVKLYAKALEVYADLLDTFDTVTEAIKEFRKTKEYQALEQGDRDEIENEIAEPPTELSGIKKALAPEEVVANTEVNRRSAEEMLDMGKKLVENGSIDPVAIINDIVEKPRALQPDEVAALVYYKAKLDKDISSTYNEIQKAMDSGDPDAELSARARANKLEIDLLSYQAMSVVTAYEQSLAFRLRKMLLDDQYNLADQITQYKANNGGTIPADVEARMREADKKIKEANAKIDELEKQQAELEKKLATQNIKEYNERQKKKSSTQKAKESADKFRERFKTKPLVIRDAAGNEITITTQGFTWNDVIEIAAKAIEKSGKIADGIKAAVDYLNGQDWYKNLSQEDKDAINTQLEEQFDEMLEGLKIPTSVVREFVENGVTDAEQLVKEVQKLYPEYSEREVMDAISGYGRKINPSIDEVRTELSRMKGVMRKLAMLEDLRNKIPKQKNPRAKAEMSKREKDLLKQIKEEFPEFGKMTEQERQDAAKVRAEEKIKEYEDRISRKDFSTKPKRKPVDMDSELIRLEAQKEKAKTVFEKEKEKLLLSQRKLGQTLWQGFKDLLNAPKAIRASLDLSAPFRQGAIFIFTQNPLKTARDIYDMYKMAGVPLPQTGNKWYDVRKYKSDKEYYEDWQNALKVSPYYPLAKRSGLYIADEDGKLTAREEVFMSGIVKNKVPFFGKGGLKERPKSTDSWAKKIWGLNLFGGSEQGYAGFLNKMRYDNFVAGAEQLISMGLDPIADAEEFKSWASFVNNATARGSLGKFEQAAETLNTFFFSPKMIAARFNLLMNPLYYYRLKPNARKMAMKRMSGFFGVMSMIIGMAAMYLNNDDDDETEVELDPRSSDFAKIKIGNTRIDVLAGFQQYIRASTQFATGERKSTKSGALSDADRFEVLVGFFANKLAPVPAIGYERARSKVDKYGVRTNMMGEVFDWKENLGELAIPLYLGDLSEIAQENSPVTAAFLATLSFHGGGVSSFGGEIDLTRKYAKKGAAMFEARTRREPNEEEYKLIVERANRQALQEIRENKRDRLKNDK